MSYWKIKTKLFFLQLLNALFFCIPLIVMFIIYKDKMINFEQGSSIAGLGIIGIIIYICGLKKALGKFPKIAWFVIILLISVFADSISDFLVRISVGMLIGYILTIPLTAYTNKLSRNANIIDELSVKQQFYKNNSNNSKDNFNESGRV